MLLVGKALQSGLSIRVCLLLLSQIFWKSTENNVLMNLLAIIMIRKLPKLQNALSFT